MALKIPCPHCGLRPHTEFTFGGELRPVDAADIEQDFGRVFIPRNEAGPQEERWFHSMGCRRWLTIERDTTTNEVL